jgi:hypothetical protein
LIVFMAIWWLACGKLRLFVIISISVVRVCLYL